MTIPHIRPTRSLDVALVARHMRPEDVREIRDVSGATPMDALIQGRHTSNPCWTITHPKTAYPVAILGVVPDGLDLGCVWMLGTPELATMPKMFLKHCKVGLGELLKRYHILHNYADCRNIVHLRWLRWMGFQFNEIITGGVNNIKLVHFSITREVFRNV